MLTCPDIIRERQRGRGELLVESEGVTLDGCCHRAKIVLWGQRDPALPCLLCCLLPGQTCWLSSNSSLLRWEIPSDLSKQPQPLGDLFLFSTPVPIKCLILLAFCKVWSLGPACDPVSSWGQGPLTATSALVWAFKCLLPLDSAPW